MNWLRSIKLKLKLVKCQLKRKGFRGIWPFQNQMHVRSGFFLYLEYEMNYDDNKVHRVCDDWLKLDCEVLWSNRYVPCFIYSMIVDDELARNHSESSLLSPSILVSYLDWNISIRGCCFFVAMDIGILSLYRFGPLDGCGSLCRRVKHCAAAA